MLKRSHRASRFPAVSFLPASSSPQGFAFVAVSEEEAPVCWRQAEACAVGDARPEEAVAVLREARSGSARDGWSQAETVRDGSVGLREGGSPAEMADWVVPREDGSPGDSLRAYWVGLREGGSRAEMADWVVLREDGSLVG